MLTTLFMLYLFTAMWAASLDTSVAAPKSKEGSSGTPGTLEKPGQAAKVDAEHPLEMLSPRVVLTARRGEKLQKDMGMSLPSPQSHPGLPRQGAKGSLKGAGGTGWLLLISPPNRQGQASQGKALIATSAAH